MRLFRRTDRQHEILEIVNRKNILWRAIQFLLGIFLFGLAFNLFFLPHQIVYGGVSGLSIVTESVFGLTPSLFIFLSSLLLMLVSLVFLGKDSTLKTVIGSLLYPLSVSLTLPLVAFFDLGELDLLMVAIFGGLTAGMGSGLIFKSGFTTGGTDILNQIVSKYFKVSIGKAMIMTDGFIVLLGAFIFGFEKALYGVIALYIISLMADRVILGISGTKSFYIMTSEVNKTREYIFETLGLGVTILDAEGGFSGKNRKLILCAIPTRDYFRLKEGVLTIDPEAFFLVTDTYEVQGGSLKKRGY